MKNIFCISLVFFVVANVSFSQPANEYSDVENSSFKSGALAGYYIPLPDTLNRWNVFVDDLCTHRDKEDRASDFDLTIWSNPVNDRIFISGISEIFQLSFFTSGGNEIMKVRQLMCQPFKPEYITLK